MFDAKVRHKLIPCFLIIADDDPLSLGDTIDVQSNAINMDVSENVNTASICSEDSDADLDFDEGECKKSIWENFNSRIFRQGQAFSTPSMSFVYFFRSLVTILNTLEYHLTPGKICSTFISVALATVMENGNFQKSRKKN